MGNYDDYNVSEQEIGEWIKDHERLLFEVVHRYAYIPEHIGCVRTLQMDKDTYDNQYGQSEFDDYFQAACIGVVKAVRTYESTNRTKFSTYAFKCAKNEVLMINRQKQAGKRGASVCFSEMSLRAFGTGEKNISSEETLGLYGTRDGEKWSNELMETFLATHTTSSCCQSLSMDPADLCSDKVFAEEIIRYAETLSHKLANILRLFLSHPHCTQDFISKKMGISQGTVSSLIKCFRTQLREFIREYYHSFEKI